MLDVQPKQVLDCLSMFSGIVDARTLYCNLRNYIYQDRPIIEDWSKLSKEVIVDGKIIARKGDFNILYFTIRRLKRTNEMPNPLPDRTELDNIVFDELGLMGEERKEVYWAVCELVKRGLEKARSLKKG